MTEINHEHEDLNLVGGRGVFSATNPMRWYFDSLFPPEPHPLMAMAKQSAQQIIVDIDGKKYVVQRCGYDGIDVLGEYNADKQPEGSNRYGFNPIENLRDVRFKVYDKLIEECKHLGYESYPKDPKEQPIFALADALKKFSRAI